MDHQYRGRFVIPLLAWGLWLALFSTSAHAVPGYVAVITGQYALGPNLTAKTNNCFLCHTNGVTGAANATLFGQTLRGINPTAAANIANALLPFASRLRAAEGLDSDGDGMLNLAEITADTDPSIVTPPASPSTVSLLLNNTTPTTGTVQTLTRTMTAGVRAGNVDIYLALVIPDGTLLVMQPNGTFSTAITAAQSNVPVQNITSQLFRYTFTGTEPIGRYIWYAGFATPGTLNFNNSITSASFFFNPNAAALNWGQGNWGQANWQ